MFYVDYIFKQCVIKKEKNYVYGKQKLDEKIQNTNNVPFQFDAETIQVYSRFLGKQINHL